jgi:hypothetical protein
LTNLRTSSDSCCATAAEQQIKMNRHIFRMISPSRLNLLLEVAS